MSENEPENDSYEGYSVDPEDQPQGGGGLEGDSTTGDRGLQDPLDEGYSPPEKWSAAEGWGNTPLEEELGETLEMRLKQEEPEPDPYEEAAREDDPDAEDLDDGEVGDRRSGRLVAPDEGLGEDVDSELLGEDVGIDGAGASAEEAAVHEVEE
ncbi:hypothetical protein D9V37_03880 [Nocardioides mangrovicus]|uniref:DUF5709 domain-containing protein n=1 Tax=Nocardioides mangrovicus TaxID=2478913 RepID=A0A3L8P8Z2_9ACTN|nr:DUF5709 domain-containing protein [Nocardioides mangrovicus]RLV51068.1 hypothetical protein D9V37_03880 [Nocardioides mangrovicus]